MLKSWAVPKQPPEEPGEKRLAVQVEDHPLDYGGFEGVIPAGEYGAGTVKIWDHGTYQLLKWTDDKVEFIVKGERLNGHYELIRFRKAGEKEWLLFREERRVARLGTMGWSYPFWVGKLYPKDIKPSGFLAEYAKHFNSVEIDATFYRIPSESTIESWRNQVPSSFKFAVKFPQRRNSRF